MRLKARVIRQPMGVRHGDTVKVMAGRDKGKTGRILAVDAARRKVTVEHANMIKRHTRPNPSQNVRGGIVEKEAPMDASNVMPLCPGCGKHARMGHTKLADGTKARVCRRCNTTLPN
jgi:large subunit ribosomal protein L24